MEGGKTNHYSLTFSLILPLALSDNCCVSSGETSVERAVSAATCILYIYIYMCVSVYIYISMSIFIHNRQESQPQITGKKILTDHCKGGRRGGKKGQLRGGAP